jgi:integrase
LRKSRDKDPGSGAFLRESATTLSPRFPTGLRAAEVISLKIGDIDSKRMVIRVEQGKGRKDRYVMLSPHLLALLRAWWKAARPQGWLFPGRDLLATLLAHGGLGDFCARWERRKEHDAGGSKHSGSLQETGHGILHV